MFELKDVNEVVQIVSAGGGVQMNGARKTTDDLVRIAAAGAKSGARIEFYGLRRRPVEDLVQIARAGKGCVMFADEPMKPDNA